MAENGLMYTDVVVIIVTSVTRPLGNVCYYYYCSNNILLCQTVAALQNELFLFQLPDVLPGVPFSKDSGQKTTNASAHNTSVE